MVRKDKKNNSRWKSEAKALRKKVSKLKRRLSRLKRASAETDTTAQVSPLAPPGGMPPLPAVAGAEFATAAAGVRYQGRTDVMLARLAPGSQIAGVFTRSATRAAPVLDCERKIGGDADNDGAAIIVNSGNANAFTGIDGQEAVAAITAAVASAATVPEARVFSSSTGVIGEPLPFDRITGIVDDLVGRLSPDAMADAARAIMTTDTYPKGSSTTVELEGKTVTIAGIAKGSGMIAPDMATMLVYVFTDARIGRDLLQKMLARLTDKTFNAITVDGDTSTSDTLLLAATGQSTAPEITDLRSKSAREFLAGLERVMMDLAHQVVKDGEGATKFIEVSVTGADSDGDARKVAMSIANSPLVKTAFAGEDPNWGRIVMAVGKSGAKADRDLLAIRFGDTLVAENGRVAPDYSEQDGAAYMKGQELAVHVDLGIGQGASTVWTCDLTHRYIDINADYRS